MRLSEQEYHAYPAWSYSKIVKYARGGFAALKTIDNKVEPTPEMRFGSLLDSILTRGLKATNATYAIATGPLPIPSVKAVLDLILVKTNATPFEEITHEDWQKAMDECDYQPKRKFETKMQILNNSRNYYDLMASGKIIVSQQDWDDAMEMAKNIKTDAYLKNIFGVGNKDGIEYIYQPQFISTMHLDDSTAASVKCMLDLMIVNHNDKVIQPVDLKTSFMPAYDFADHFVKMRYDIQAQVCTTVLADKLKHIPEYKDYSILPYLFVDISRTDKVPVTYSYDPQAQPDGFSFGEYTYKNWKQLLQEMLEYQDTDAVVPSYIKTDGPNDLLSILNRNRTNE